MPSTFLSLIKERLALAERNVSTYRERLALAELELQTWANAERLELDRHAHALGGNQHMRVTDDLVPSLPALAPATNGKHPPDNGEPSHIETVYTTLRDYGAPITSNDLKVLLPGINGGTVSGSLVQLRKTGRLTVESIPNPAHTGRMHMLYQAVTTPQEEV